MHVFTSVTANYIPKARVLAQSVKRHHPEAHFSLVLSDDRPDWLAKEGEPFDEVILASELNIPNFHSWAFKHSVVEMCTAVKGTAFQHIIRDLGGKKVFFLDPDMVIFERMDHLLDRLDHASILLTPHQTQPETTRDAVSDNEISSLKHGVFNLGFLGIRASDEGRRFIDWWAARLLEFCYDDISNGLFTDQRWVDLAPCFFEDIYIVRSPGFNVATWNLTHRTIGGTLDRLTANGEPLVIYHFSGFDSGAQEVMLNKYGAASPVLKELRAWYIDECARNGQNEYGKSPSKYQFFANGAPITKEHRMIYRWRRDLEEHYPDPYVISELSESYFDWFQRSGVQALHAFVEFYPTHPFGLDWKLRKLRAELERVYGSRTWRLSQLLGRVAQPLLALRGK